jgi:hypothetical protein
VVSLFWIGRRLVSDEVGLGLVCLYCGSAYVLGVGGERALMGGMTYVSHIAPAALSLAAFAFLGTPFVSGALLALAAGFLFYPVFFLPAWFGYYFWRRGGARWGWVQFASGFVGAVAILAAITWAYTAWEPGESAIAGFLDQTFGHQALDNPARGGGSYGDSPFGFWGTHPGARAFWQEPLADSGFTQPAFLSLGLLVAATFFLARGRRPHQLACLIAATAIAAQMWKPHAGGTYVTWYYPFLLIGLFANGGSSDGSLFERADAGRPGAGPT